MDGLQRIHVGEVVSGDVQYNATSLIVPDNYSFDDWQSLTAGLFEVEKRHKWWIGDCLRHGEARWGERYAQAIDCGVNYNTALNYNYVANRFSDLSRRRDNLSWSHHAEAAALPAGEGDRVLTLAEECSWSVHELRAYIKGKPHVAANSGNNEWYTPPYILDRAREALGGFDLDPASSEVANRFVAADRYFTADDDALSIDWPVGRLWMNPPYSQPLCARFCERFADEVKRGSTGIVLVNNATETLWFQTLASVASAICFPQGRIKYLDETGEPKNTPLQGQAILYFGAGESFADVFADIGFVVRP